MRPRIKTRPLFRLTGNFNLYLEYKRKNGPVAQLDRATAF